MDKINDTIYKAQGLLESCKDVLEIALLYVCPLLLLGFVIALFLGAFPKLASSTLKAEASFISFAKSICGFLYVCFEALSRKWLKWVMLSILIIWIIVEILYFTLWR